MKRKVILCAAAVVWLTSIATAEDQKIRKLEDDLRSSDSRVRQQAAIALDQAGPAAKEAIMALIGAVEDRNLNVRYWAASALKRLGPEAKSAVSALTRVLKTFPGGNPELEGPTRYFPDIRAVAAEALGNIGVAAKDAIPALKEATHDKDASVREAALAALKQIEPQQK